jgi:hypothetical protein
MHGYSDTLILAQMAGHFITVPSPHNGDLVLFRFRKQRTFHK